MTCVVDDCVRDAEKQGRCNMHYLRWRKTGDEGRAAPLRGQGCAVEGCERDHYARTFCYRHYVANRKYGDPEHRLIGIRGEGTITRHGYRRICIDGRYVLEHRLVIERIVGRVLFEDETVHHKNGDKLDNRPENLELWSSWHPKGQRVEDKIAWAKELLRRYGEL